MRTTLTAAMVGFEYLLVLGIAGALAVQLVNMKIPNVAAINLALLAATAFAMGYLSSRYHRLPLPPALWGSQLLPAAITAALIYMAPGVIRDFFSSSPYGSISQLGEVVQTPWVPEEVVRGVRIVLLSAFAAQYTLFSVGWWAGSKTGQTPRSLTPESDPRV